MSPDHKAYGAMLAETSRLSLPLSFTTDLTTHDRAHLATVDPSLPFVWCLYERGTHLAMVDPENGNDDVIDRRGTRLGEIFDSWEECGPGSNFYGWNGSELERLGSDASDARRWVEELSEEYWAKEEETEEAAP